MGRFERNALNIIVLAVLFPCIYGFLYNTGFLAALNIEGNVPLSLSDSTLLSTNQLVVLCLAAIITFFAMLWQKKLSTQVIEKDGKAVCRRVTRFRYYACGLLVITGLYVLAVVLFGVDIFKLSYTAFFVFFAGWLFANNPSEPQETVNGGTRVLIASLIALGVYFAGSGFDDATQSHTMSNKIIVNEQPYFLIKAYRHGFLVKALNDEKNDYLTFISDKNVVRFKYHIHEIKGIFNLGENNERR